MTPQSRLPTSMRLLLISDGLGDSRRLFNICQTAARQGSFAIILREPTIPAAQLAQLCTDLRQILHGPILVNDRADFAACGLADGVHLKQSSLPANLVRPILPQEALLGISIHNAKELEEAETHGSAADYFLLAPVMPTTSKPKTQALGLATTKQLIAKASKPVILLGGLNPDNWWMIHESSAFGGAVMSGVFAAKDPGQAVAQLLEAQA